MSAPQSRPENNGEQSSGKTQGPSSRAPRGSGGIFRRKSVNSLVLLAILAIYAFAQPRLNDRYGWNLPGLGDASQRESGPAENRNPSASGNPSPDVAPRDVPPSDGPESLNRTATSKRPSATPEKARPQLPQSPAKPTGTQNRSAPTRGSPARNSTRAESKDQEQLKYGLLREIQPDRYMSPEGLLYTPGSAEGHRLEHLRRHTKDLPSRPGSHGVFDGGMEGALKTVDRAYDRAKKNQRTTKFVDDGRTIYTVDMGSRVGFVGGQTGNQRRKPMARRVKLILEGTRVITAYPL